MISFFRVKVVSITALIFIFNCGYLFADQNSIDDWQRLLHFHSDKFQILDKSFFIDGIPSNPKQELDKTISLLNNNDRKSQDFACKFPARFNWVVNNIETFNTINLEQVNLSFCPHYQEYIQKVPVDEISLVFAAENITSPMSMMGHVFIMISGYDEDSIQRQHAFSYFAVINSFNPFLFITESILTGQEGKFGLTPYQTTLFNYTQKEGRSVWEYRLKSSEKSNSQLRDHIFELKDIQPDYLFTQYNCATFIYDLLKLLNPELEIRGSKHLWITPRDLVKDLIKIDALDKQTIFINPVQAMKLVKTDIHKNTRNLKPIDFINNYQVKKLTEKSVYDKIYIRHLNQVFYDKNLTTVQAFEKINKLTNDIEDDYFFIPGPEKASNDTQASLGIKNVNQRKFGTISLMPASHTQLDSSAAFFTENELKLGELLISFNENTILIDELTLYSVKNFNTLDPHVKNLTWGWNLGLNRKEPFENNKTLSFNTEFGMGATVEINNILQIYNLNYIGTYFNQYTKYPYFKPEVGLLLNFNNKLKANIHTNNTYKKSNQANYTQLSISIEINKNYRAVIQSSINKNGLTETKTTELKVVHYF